MDIKEKAEILQKALESKGIRYICIESSFELEDEDHDPCDWDYFLVDLLDETKNSYGSFIKDGHPVLMKLDIEFAIDCQSTQPLDLKICSKLAKSLEDRFLLNQGIGSGLQLSESERPCQISLDNFSWEKLAIDGDLGRRN